MALLKTRAHPQPAMEFGGTVKKRAWLKGLGLTRMSPPEQCSVDSRINTDVLIVGGGPVGLTLAIDLAQRGIEVTVADTQLKVVWKE